MGFFNAWYTVGVSEMFVAWVKDSDTDPWHSHSWWELLRIIIRLDHTRHENPHRTRSTTGKRYLVWPLLGGNVVCISVTLHRYELWWISGKEHANPSWSNQPHSEEWSLINCVYDNELINKKITWPYQCCFSAERILDTRKLDLWTELVFKCQVT